MQNVGKILDKNTNDCNCGCNDCKSLGRIRQVRRGKKTLGSTDFFSELFPADATGKRSFTFNVALDIPSVLMLTGGVLVAGYLIKKS